MGGVWRPRFGPAPPPPPDSAAWWQAIETMRLEGVLRGLAALEGFVSERPHSPWTPGVRAALAEYDYAVAEAERPTDEARVDLARCLRRCLIAWSESDANLERAREIFQTYK